MQLGSPGALPAEKLTAQSLKKRIRSLGLLCLLEVLLALPVSAAGYYLGAHMQPDNAQATQIWSWASGGVLLLLFIAAIIVTLRARKAAKDTLSVQEELTSRIQSEKAKHTAVKQGE